ncbi:MAG: hypothetical protein QM487_03835 [Candidatus Marithrix sp.]
MEGEKSVELTAESTQGEKAITSIIIIDDDINSYVGPVSLENVLFREYDGYENDTNYRGHGYKFGDGDGILETSEDIELEIQLRNNSSSNVTTKIYIESLNGTSIFIPYWSSNQCTIYSSQGNSCTVFLRTNDSASTGKKCFKITGKVNDKVSFSKMECVNLVNNYLPDFKISSIRDVKYEFKPNEVFTPEILLTNNGNNS